MSLFVKALDKMSRAKQAKRADVSDIKTGNRSKSKSSRPASQSRSGPFAKGANNPKKIQVNIEKLLEAGFLVEGDAGSRLADQFRRIKRPLLDNAFGANQRQAANQNVLMITSAMPGEGKTFMALNLAISMAREKDLTVLLVDADVAKPGLSRLLELESEQGLIDVLSDENLDVSDVLYRTDVDSLVVLPAGSQDSHATELLASNRMMRVVEELSTRYPDRMIVFDSPPLLVTSEAQVLSSVAGQIAVVVQASRTPQKVAQEALDLLDAEKAINLILNKCERMTKASYYGGSYGYGNEGV